MRSGSWVPGPGAFICEKTSSSHPFFFLMIRRPPRSTRTAHSSGETLSLSDRMVRAESVMVDFLLWMVADQCLHVRRSVLYHERLLGLRAGDALPLRLPVVFDIGLGFRRRADAEPHG